jgi:hypothetical protein
MASWQIRIVEHRMEHNMSRHHHHQEHNEHRGHEARNDRDENGSRQHEQDNGQHANGTDQFQVFATNFTALNNSGVSGGAAIVLDKASHTVTVEIDATNLEPNQVHPQHIHGFLDDTKSHSPTIAQDTDHDGFVELNEGLATYGQILLNLSLNPDNSTHDHGTASPALLTLP